MAIVEVLQKANRGRVCAGFGGAWLVRRAITQAGMELSAQLGEAGRSEGSQADLMLRVSFTIEASF